MNDDLQRWSEIVNKLVDENEILVAKNEKLQEALLAASSLVDACSRKLFISKKWSNAVREQIDAVLPKRLEP